MCVLLCFRTGTRAPRSMRTTPSRSSLFSGPSSRLARRRSKASTRPRSAGASLHCPRLHHHHLHHTTTSTASSSSSKHGHRRHRHASCPRAVCAGTSSSWTHCCASKARTCPAPPEGSRTRAPRWGARPTVTASRRPRPSRRALRTHLGHISSHLARVWTHLAHMEPDVISMRSSPTFSHAGLQLVRRVPTHHVHLPARGDARRRARARARVRARAGGGERAGRGGGRD